MVGGSGRSALSGRSAGVMSGDEGGAISLGAMSTLRPPPPPVKPVSISLIFSILLRGVPNLEKVRHVQFEWI